MDTPETDSADVTWTDMTWLDFEDSEVRVVDIPIFAEDYSYQDRRPEDAEVEETGAELGQYESL